MGERRLQVASDPELVLRKPQHYHIGAFLYRNLAPDGINFEMSTYVERVANDVTLAKSLLQKYADPAQTNMHVREIRQCSDPQHLENA